MHRATFLSPHLDDAIFSAGGLMARLLDAGTELHLVTVFTRSMAHPAGFALDCQTSKGLPPEADYMAIRRAEDLAAAGALGLPSDRVHHLDLPEAPHRGYTSAADLFAGIHASDAGFIADVAAAIAPHVAADRVYVPLGHGNHVDHLHVLAAANEPGRELHRWHDTPYVLRCPPQVRRLGEPAAADFARKLDACAAYTTQLPFQFGGEAAMRETLADLHAQVGERFVIE